MGLILAVIVIVVIVLAVRGGKNSFSLGFGNVDSIRSHMITGTVTGSKKFSETHVSGSGTGSGYGPVSMSVTSSSTVHQEFFIRDKESVDHPIKIWGLDIPVADGQQVTLSRSEIGERSRPAYLINHSARRGWPLYTTPSQVAIELGVLPGTAMLYAKAAGVGVLAGWLAGSLAIFSGLITGLIAAISWVVFELRRRSSVGRELKVRYLEEEKATLAKPAMSA